MENTERRIQRLLQKDNGEIINAEAAFNKKYDKIFGGSIAEMVGIINILTAYNDYKKLHDDLFSCAEACSQKVIRFSGNSRITDMTSYKSLINLCRHEKLLNNNILPGILKILEVFLCLLSIFQIVYSLVYGSLDNMWVSYLTISLLLIAAIFFSIRLLTTRQKYNLFAALDSMEEASLIKLFDKISLRESHLCGERIYFVENLSKLDKLCRCYLIAYFQNVEYLSQLWCIFDYLFENTGKLTEFHNKIYHDTYRLTPLSYTEKETLYSEFNLQRDICREYLNCIGADILWSNQSDTANAEFKFHSLNYIKNKILKIKNAMDLGGDLTKGFYCLVYMSAKYKYSYSIEHMVSLLLNKENADSELTALIQKASGMLGITARHTDNELTVFLKKMIEILESYYFTEVKIQKGKKIRRYKFSYDILECFQQELETLYPDDESVRLWVLAKLIGNKALFQQERYFYDCSNLLVMNEFMENQDYLVLSSRLLRMLNSSQCWVYYGPILDRLVKLYTEEADNARPLANEDFDSAVINNLFYISDDFSIQLGISFFFPGKAPSFTFDLLSEDILSGILGDNRLFADYFKLLYQVFIRTIALHFDLSYTPKDILPSENTENFPLYSIIKEFISLCLDCFEGSLTEERYLQYGSRLQKYLKKAPACEEALVFQTVVKELLFCIKSELHSDTDRDSRNTNVGMLIETSNSNMLYFIYGLLNMIFLKDRDAKFYNHNELLNFISQSFYYFNVLPNGEGITKYTNYLISSTLPLSLKLNVLMSLLAKGASCVTLIKDFVLGNLDAVSDLVTEGMDGLNNEAAIEKYLGKLLLYIANINSAEFTDKIFGNIKNFLVNNTYCSTDTLILYLKGILYNEWPEEESPDIIRKINHIQTPAFAIWVLNSYCNASEEILQRLPSIRLEILLHSSTNIGTILMAKYLLTHGYYDSNHNILNLYLESIKRHNYPSKSDIANYLNIIDHYGKDNAGFKLNEMQTYNYLESLYLFYILLEMQEQQAQELNYPRKTLEFIVNLYRGLNSAGLSYTGSNSIMTAYTHNKMQPNPAAEKFILGNFMELSPIITKGAVAYLSLDYFSMIIYIINFPAIYPSLAEHAKAYQTEVLKHKHILGLVNLLIDTAQNDSLGFNLESLMNVKTILSDMYHIRL